jgi:hypothetical protein
MRNLIVAVLFAAASSVLEPIAAQQPADQAVSARTRFSGVLTTLVNGRPLALKIDYRAWILAPGTKLDKLGLDASAHTLLRLHSGKLTSLAAEKRARRAGEFWELAPGEAMQLIAEDDSVIFETISVRPGATRKSSK